MGDKMNDIIKILVAFGIGNITGAVGLLTALIVIAQLM